MVGIRFSQQVFPAYAGMFRFFSKFPAKTERFPRIRGDVPGHFSWSHPHAKFSPHTRGCSSITEIAQAYIDVFPAYAGMFLPSRLDRVISARFPRIRGDVPQSHG